jgi:hypothetical protein
LDAKASCVAATTADITLSAAQTIDGISVIAGNRVLVKNQTLSQNNGIYLCASGAWTRTTDADTWDELTSAYTFIETGTVNADCGFVCTANAGGTLGTTALPWSQFSGAGSYTASTGLTLTGTVFSLTTPVAVANGGTGVTTSTGTTNVVLSGSPTITTPVIAQINDANGNETLKLASVGSAINEVTIENAPSGSAVHISASGGDASVGLHLAGKGASGYVNVQDSTDATKRLMFNAAGGTTNTRTMLSSTQTVDRTLSLPDATDTLVGRATTDTLTNKTITGGILNGTLGATTPSTVAATTVTASGTNTAFSATGATTSARYFNANNTGGQLYLGVEDSVGGNVFSGSSAYSGFIGTNGNTNFHLGHNGVVKATITSTGLNSTAIGATTPSTGAFTTVAGTTGTFTGIVTIGGTAQLTGSAPKLEIYHGTAVKHNISGTDVLSVSSGGAAVTGALSATGNITSTTGVFQSVTGTGVRLSAPNNTSATIGVDGGNQLVVAGYSPVTISTGLAVTGALSCTGALSKGSGSFRIEHPLPSKSATHQLVHSFIEGPKCDLIYRGKINLVDGKASVNIDTDSTMTEGTFEVLCANVQCFTSNESGWGAIRGKVTGNILTIEAQDAASTDNVSWMVIGERKDPHIMDTDWTDKNGRPIVEPLKPVEPALESK